MRKTIVKISFIVAFLLTVGLILYFYFPQIWGEAVYPLKYEDQILKYSNQFNLKPTLVAAVIFHESRFNADSVSRMGAIGLMQLMPTTASSIARNLGEDFKVSMLYEPETNIRYGTWYLKNLSDRYQGNFDLVLAAYNGGPAVADRWLEARAAPYGETASFISSVKKTESMYAKIYPQLLSPQPSLRKTPPEPTLWQKIFKGILEGILYK